MIPGQWVEDCFLASVRSGAVRASDLKTDV